MNSNIVAPVYKAYKLKEVLSEGKNLYLLDVREPEEYELTHISGSDLVPMMEIDSRIDDIDDKIRTASSTIVICRSGQRSEVVTEYLLHKGYENVFNLEGGLIEYSKFDSSVKVY